MKKILILFTVLATTFVYGQTNLLVNGAFDNGGVGWSTFTPKLDSTGSISLAGGNATFTSANVTGNNWDNFGFYQAVTLTPGTYVMDFDLSFNGLNDTWGDLLLGNIQPENGKDYKVGGTAPNEIAALSWIEEIYNTWDCSNGSRNNADVIRTGINNDGSVVKASSYIEKASHVGSSCDSSATSGSINFEITTAGTYYIVFKSGNWEGRFGSTGVIIDNMTLYAAGAFPLDFEGGQDVLTANDGNVFNTISDGGSQVGELIGATAPLDNYKLNLAPNLNLSNSVNNSVTFKIKPIGDAGLTTRTHLLKFENYNSSTELEFTTIGNDWQTKTLNFGSGLGNYNLLILFTDYNNNETGTYLIDDFYVEPDPSTCTDGIKNGTETGIDCGGTCTECPSPTVAANTPTQAAVDVISVYSGPYTNVPVSTFRTSWSVGGALEEDYLVAGNPTLKYNSLTYAGIDINTANQINATAMENFHIDMWTHGGTTFNVRMIDFGPNGVFGGGDDKDYSVSVIPTEDSWNNFDIPMSSFSGLTTRGNISTIILSSNDATVYIDNMYFWKMPDVNYYADLDGDGYGAGAATISNTPIPGYVINNSDCDDANAAINPGATEIFDTLDNDCDGSVDEDTSLPSSLTFCKGVTVASVRGTTDLQLYTSTSVTAVALSGTTALSSKVYYATLNGSARTAVTVTVNLLPSTPASMTTSDAVLCKHIGTTNEVTYTVPASVAVAPAVVVASYSWSLPPGVTAIGATNTNSITVNFAGSALNNTSVGGIGTISARAISTDGCLSAPRALILTSKLPTSPTSLTMTSTDSTDHFNLPVVPATIPATYTFSSLVDLTKITKVGPYMGTSTVFILTAATAATAASYAWTLPAGVNQLSGDNSNIITVDFAGVTPGIGLLPIEVKSVGGCGSAAVARKLSLARALPTAPTALVVTDDAISTTTALTKVSAYTGKTTPLTLTATPVKVQGATATSYAWILPAGVNIISPAETTYVTVQQSVNTGNFTPEGAPIFEIQDFTAKSTGTTSTITVDFAGVAEGTLSFPLTVFAINGAGNSKARIRTVTAAAPTSPAITAAGGTTFNNCNLKTYSVVQTLGTSYTWSVPAGATYVQTGNQIVVDYTAVEAAVGATVQVSCIASNGTGSSLPKSLNVKRVACPVRLSGSSASAFSVKAYPNPSSSEFTIETSAKGAMSVKVYDMQGRLVEKANTDKVGARLAKGVYNVIVNQGANTKSVRVIKK